MFTGRERFLHPALFGKNEPTQKPARRRTELLDISEEEYDLVLDVNLKGTFLTTQAAVPAMLERGGGTNCLSLFGIRTKRRWRFWHIRLQRGQSRNYGPDQSSRSRVDTTRHSRQLCCTFHG